MGDIPQWGYQAWQGGIGELGVEWDYCNQEWANCAPQPQACAFTGICNNCASYLAKPFKSASCCQSATPQPCFESVLAGANNANLATPSSALATITDPNLSVCATALSGLSACEAATPSFTALDPSAQASCLCYNSGGSFVESAFDRPWSSCVAFAQTADASDYPALSSAMDFCASFGGQQQAQQTPATSGGSAGTGGSSAGTGGVTQASKTSASPGSATRTSAPQTSAAGSTASASQIVATSGARRVNTACVGIVVLLPLGMLLRTHL